MDVLLVVDMQEAAITDGSKHDLRSVIDRINELTAHVRERHGVVVFVQHDGEPGSAFAPGTPGWEIAKCMTRDSTDRIVHKETNDSFQDTGLEELLRSLGAERVIPCGWATDFCVDNTVRSAVSRGFHVVVPSDGHTLQDRPHLSAADVIAHHNWVWSNLIAPASVTVASSRSIMNGD